VGNIAKNGVQNSITDLELLTNVERRHGRMAAAMTTWSNLDHSILSRCFNSFRSVMRILYTFS